jgi:cell division protein FtsA
VLESLAAGQAVLSDEERELGSIVIDMGGGTTDTAVFRDGSVVHACVLPVGGHQISNDLAFGLRASIGSAEELKIRYGSTISHARPEGEAVPVPGSGQEDNQSIEQRTIAEIVDARLAETFELVQTQVARAGFGDDYSASVVLTGGSAQIPGAPSLASDIFGIPARLGVPLGVHGLADALRSPAFSTSVGLLAWGREQLAPDDTWQGSGQLERIGATLRAWLRNFFP